jgi:curved DNA-binding protein CbpA
MNPDKDYYGILGVLPSAEDIVIRAAYRALAQRYHPDHFDGDKGEAHRRMVDINEAYQTLSNASARREYDRLRGARTRSAETFFDDESEGPQSRADPLEREWNIARKYYPDLAGIESRLSRISWRLGYSYRAHLLEAKLFDQRDKVASLLEQNFLETYFGKNPHVVKFARELIETRNRPAAKALNEAVCVLGSDVDPFRIIDQIHSDFGIGRYTGIPSGFRTIAENCRRGGLDEAATRDQLVSRGLRQQDAEALVRQVFRGR